jgi:pyruvate carboxylase subunit B
MRYFVTIGRETLEVDLSNGAVTIGGQVVDAELREIPGTQLRHLLVDGQSWPLVAREGSVGGEWDIHMNGMRVRAGVVDERTRAIREMTGQSAESRRPRPLRAPMPGLIVRLEVAPGQPVQSGDGVVIIEAMKMENELRAESAGVVERIHVAAGQAVEKGALLVEFAAGE